jgi:hypothetical protein
MRLYPLAVAVLVVSTLHARALPPRPLDPCALLTLDQIKASAGEAVMPGKPGAGDSAGSCTWKNAKGGDLVYLEVKDAGADYKSFRDQMQATGKLVPVTGMAEDAFYVSGSGTSAALYSLKARHLLLITVDGAGFSKADNEGAEKVLMVKVLGRIS